MKEKKAKVYLVKYCLIIMAAAIYLGIYLYALSSLDFEYQAVVIGIAHFVFGVILVWLIPKIICCCIQSQEKESINPQL